MASNESQGQQPDSTLARSFSASLNDAFNIEGDLGNLHESVEQKKKEVTTQSQELEALEAKLRATEDALKQKTGNTSASNGAAHRRAPVANTYHPPENATQKQKRGEPVMQAEEDPDPEVAAKAGDVPGAIEA